MLVVAEARGDIPQLNHSCPDIQHEDIEYAFVSLCCALVADGVLLYFRLLSRCLEIKKKIITNKK